MIDSNTFVVFDLDDTLYEESEYQSSGLFAVAKIINRAYGNDLKQKILEWKTAGVRDIFSEVCRELGLPASAKEGFIWTYRLHKPTIKLSINARETVNLIENGSAGIAILTDGRSISQRLKLSALGLLEYPLYISEEWGSEKPELDRFEEIQRRHPARTYVYVGDNPSKDFKAPNQLGWETIGLRGNDKNIHLQTVDGLPSAYHPKLWISKLEELRDYLC
ncbi:MAG: HAD family hydrolase [Gammaproteobacteria bacterium]